MAGSPEILSEERLNGTFTLSSYCFTMTALKHNLD